MQTKVFLSEDEMPRQWYNIAADLPSPMQPPLGPGGIPITPEMLAPVFPMNIIEQEVSTQRSAEAEGGPHRQMVKNEKSAVEIPLPFQNPTKAPRESTRGLFLGALITS